MLYFDQAELIYVAHSQASNGSPKELTMTRTTRIKEIKTFSRNYYTSADVNQRMMRYSKNFVIPFWMTEDVIEDEKRYELTYVVYQGLKYRVKEVLKYWKTELRMILDCEEVR